MLFIFYLYSKIYHTENQFAHSRNESRKMSIGSKLNLEKTFYSKDQTNLIQSYRPRKNRWLGTESHMVGCLRNVELFVAKNSQ